MASDRLRRRTPELKAILGLFLLVVLGLAVVTLYASAQLAAARAYVGGESLWAKAQKDGIYALYRYAATGEQSYFETFERAMAVILGDRRARIALEQPTPDLAVAREGLRAGRLHPDDIDGMIRLFLTFRHAPYMSDAIDIWARADDEIEQLRNEAEALQAAVTAAPRDQARIDQVLARIDRLHTRLTEMGVEFSATLSEAARWTQRLVQAAIVVASIVLLVLATFFSHRVLSRLASSERALAERERQYRSVVENVRDVIFQTDEQGRWTFLSPAWTAVTGHAVESSLGRSFLDFMDPSERERQARAFERLLTRRVQPEWTVQRCLTADGGWRFLEIRLTLMTDPSGRTTGTTGTLTDVTDRLRAEEALRESQAQLREVEKLTAVGQLAGGVAHDFNNLLTVILGYAGEQRRTLPGGPMREGADEIVRAAERGAQLTRQLLAFSRRQVVEPTLLDVNAIVDDMRGMIERLIGEHITLEVIAGERTGRVRADRGQLEQVLLNLAVNARDAMPDGGRLQIETTAVSRVDADTLSARPTHAVIRVSDSGAGMDDETRARLFEPFFTTKVRGKGTGLGLAVVHGIVEQSGGEIDVESSLGQGTTFRIYLPWVDAGVPAATRRLEGTAPLDMGGQETILVVEDEAPVRAMAVAALTRLGYHVIAAHNGEHALTVAEGHDGPIDLLLTDVVMPRMGGAAVARRLFDARPGLQVLFMSGYTDDALGNHGVLDARDRLLNKPFTLEQLSRRVREALDDGQAARRRA